MAQKITLQHVKAIAIPVICIIISVFFIPTLFKSNPTIEKQMKKAAEEINKSTPRMIDSETQLDSVSAMPNRTFRYYYQLVNFNREDVDTVNIKNIMMPIFINNVKTNPSMKYLRDKKVCFSYYCSDKNGDYICEMSITPQMYK